MIEKLYDLLFDENNEEKNTIDYTKIFKLPIEYIDEKIELSENILTDLELLNTEEKHSLYNNIFFSDSLFSTTNLNFWCKYYTNNEKFLLESQNLIKNFNDIKLENNISQDISSVYKIEDDKIYEICSEIIEDTGFIDKYHYIDLSLFKHLNNNELVLQCLAIQNLSSPVLSLIIPLLSLLIPFFLIKFQGHNITWKNYIDYLKVLFKNHVIGQFFTNFMNCPIEKKMYILISLFFYGYQIYNNINICRTFYKNIKHIHDTLNTIKIYLSNTIKKIDNYLTYSSNLYYYKNFNDDLYTYRKKIQVYLDNLYKIKKYEINLSKLMELGHLMKCFYIINSDNDLIDTIKFSFGFNGYINNLNKLQIQIKNKNMTFCKYSNKTKTKLSKSYYAALNNKNPIKNDIKLKNNMIITGPNAAGKTTLLKSVLFNIILSQQIGCGFYKNATIKIYDFIHCYINIPDTCGRDSLFQAECRKCKEILDIIENNSNKNHLCVFDELYSGTNPYEAVASGYSYLDYISKFKNVNFVLTTHYIELCKKLNNNTNKNYHMLIEYIDNSNNDYEYKYKLIKGISKIKGGIKVLRDLNYPSNIVNNMEKSLKKDNLR